MLLEIKISVFEIVICELSCLYLLLRASLAPRDVDVKKRKSREFGEETIALNSVVSTVVWRIVSQDNPAESRLREKKEEKGTKARRDISGTREISRPVLLTSIQSTSRRVVRVTNSLTHAIQCPGLFKSRVRPKYRLLDAHSSSRHTEDRRVFLPPIQRHPVTR